MCRVLGVSASAYYDWLGKKSPSARELHSRDLNERVASIFHASSERYGAPRVHQSLFNQGFKCNIKTVAKSMAEQSLCAKAGKKFKPKMTDSNHSLKIYDNLLQQDFTATKVNEKWVGDITYLDTQEGWLYLAIILDLFSRKVIGWSISRRMDKVLVCNAFRNAMAARGNPTGVIMHTDRGSQYCSNDYRDLISSTGTLGSMSAKGCCYDNAVAESFFHSMKVELIQGNPRALTGGEMSSSVFRYIETFYNRERLHSTCGFMSPEQFEAQALVA